ncbi:MAG TPA: DNA recombination protein RmuC [Lactococcus sp.]|uniref:DNA recombination protein RmuC n=1 Tax=Lactococcus TaxID=1357 RepID=UPI000E9FA686|nr:MULTISPECIES: DNA recombination protein RmuC [Lactococcus]MBL3716732.1 DNA recombination protein RmuC [Lactococcus garvieae]HBC91293.1 DNA recombination protein RmuC [Lactococcus sp.]
MNIFIIILLILALLIGTANLFKKPAIDSKLNARVENLSSNLTELRLEMSQQLGQNRQEMSGTVLNLSHNLNENLSNLTENINTKFDHQFKDLQSSNEQKLDKIALNLAEMSEAMTEKFDRKFQELQEANDKKLSQIQNTVDEKLQETLNKRISQSFEQVTNLLTSVDKGLGEMRNLASDVDSLQKVMTGVKTRGIIGEVQLGRILDQIFTAGQYQEQVNIQERNAVDFAVVMPGKLEGSDVLLPIDSKFPLEDYQRLQAALETNDTVAIEASRKALFAAVKAQAKSISEKYILPPKTTDFAIMFLPIEGLFMEVVNNTELYEQLSRDYKVNITGPTTMTAVLNSLQMGFKTLQIEQKSSEVYEMLGAVKTEFGKFETSLKKVHERLQQSEKEINTLITTRTNVMNRKLRTIDAIDKETSAALLEIEGD